ncbi:hypothetical protein WAI453_001817 [Rhynchosporium graminicola]
MWLSWFVIAAIWWAFSQRSDGHYLIEKQTFFDLSTLDGLKYIDATHPYIRYVGRWLATADQTHKDGSFPGVYFDFTLNGSSTVLISLHNSDHQDQSPAKVFRSSSSALPFLPLTNSSRAAPISLLVRIDDEEYIVLPNATSLVSICPGNLNPLLRHEIRIIAPMVGNDAVETLQIEGIWINEGGQLLPHPGSPNPGDRFKQQTKTSAPRRMVEIVTDLPGSTASKEKSKNTGTARSIMNGVLGWEYLLGEMFGSDHVTIGNEGMCLIPDCIGDRGSPAGLADVFFQCGPAGSEQYSHPWFFQEYTPDVIVLNIGSSDWDSFQTHTQEYNKTLWDLSVSFEETYFKMIQAIRTLAYPKRSATTMDASRYIYSAQTAAAGVPIFVMRPFRGQLEQATHAVVDRLRKGGDKNVFWLDTSGWLNTEIDFDGRAEDQDFFLDGRSLHFSHSSGANRSGRRKSVQTMATDRARQSKAGHPSHIISDPLTSQRVAILLHMHVCRYLAREVDKCAFLPPEIYLGGALDHDAIRLNEFLEGEKERKLKKLFWK